MDAADTHACQQKCPPSVSTPCAKGTRQAPNTRSAILAATLALARLRVCTNSAYAAIHAPGLASAAKEDHRPGMGIGACCRRGRRMPSWRCPKHAGTRAERAFGCRARIHGVWTSCGAGLPATSRPEKEAHVIGGSVTSASVGFAVACRWQAPGKWPSRATGALCAEYRRTVRTVK